MNNRKPNQIKAEKRKNSLLIRVSVLAILIAVLLCGCGKKKTNDDTQAAETASHIPPATETAYNPSAIEDTQPQGYTYAEETEAEGSESVFYPLNFSDVSNFQCDYGFSENRAWVRSDTFEYDLINTNGEIIYEVPSDVMVEGLSEPVNWYEGSNNYYVCSFNPVINGTTYITGKVNYQYDVSVIIDADGNELAHFIGTDDMDCYIAGRTEDRFLLICVDKSGNESKLYCVPIGNDGKPADDPRLISQGWVSRDSVKVASFGEGIFYLDNLDTDYFAYYNLNNNTVQKSVSWEGRDDTCQFYDGVTLANGYLLTLDMLQADRTNLVFTERVFDTVSHTYSQLGRVWDGSFNETHIFDHKGNEITIPTEIGNTDSSIELQGSDDGYVLFKEYTSTGKILLSMMDPDNNFLYIQKAFSDESEPKIGCGGYVLVDTFDDDGIIDRDGVFHALSDDLSALPGLSELYFMGFGSGCMLEIEMHLGVNQDSGTALIRSLDGKQEITSVKRTASTRFMSDTLVSDTIIDLSQAKPVGLSGSANTAEITSEDEIRSMGEFGIIVVDDVLDERLDVLLFEKDGVSITLHHEDNGLFYQIKNENPNNKKADIYMYDTIFYDGIYSDRLRGNPEGSNLKSGESDSIYSGIVISTQGEFMSEMSRISTGLAELPLEEITFHFNVQIGSDTEPVYYTRVLRSASYSEENLSALYGDLVGDYEYEGELIYSVYRVKDETANVFAIRNRTGIELNTEDLSLFIAEGQWYVNGEPYIGKVRIVIPAEGVGIVTFSDVDSVYKELELPNGTPIDLGLSIPVPGTELYGEMMMLELGPISN